MNETRDAVVIGGGQSGLASASALQARGLTPLVLEAGSEPLGSWPAYYDSLTLFSPARYSSLPGLPFPGDPQRYPHRDEVIDYLRTYAKRLNAEVRTGTRVTSVHGSDGRFIVTSDSGEEISTPRLICATGGFGQPHRPPLPGLDAYTGHVLHASEYRGPDAFAGQRIVVVGAGNSAIQIAAELAEQAQTTIASRKPVNFVPQRPLGRDVHFWFTVTRIDAAPVGPWLRHPPTVPVFDTGRYRSAVRAGAPDRRPMFTTLDANEVVWSDGHREHVDTIILATGYRPDVRYLTHLNALDVAGHPLQRRGISTTHAGLGFVGLEWQRALSSASLRGVGRDARYVVARLTSSTRAV